MSEYQITTAYGTTYRIDEDGCFLGYGEHKWEHPHDSWKCTGCAEVISFGNLRYFSLPEFLKMIELGHNWKHKNGKPRYTLVDLDHGTRRVHGNIKAHGISSAWKIPEGKG